MLLSRREAWVEFPVIFTFSKFLSVKGLINLQNPKFRLTINNKRWNLPFCPKKFAL